jgi:hypothetical protein
MAVALRNAERMMKVQAIKEARLEQRTRVAETMAMEIAGVGSGVKPVGRTLNQIASAASSFNAGAVSAAHSIYKHLISKKVDPATALAAADKLVDDMVVKFTEMLAADAAVVKEKLRQIVAEKAGHGAIGY